MCGRFTLHEEPESLLLHFELERMPLLPPRFNIAPGGAIAAIGVAQAAERASLRFLHWGLSPAWSRGRGPGSVMINARSESVAEKPSFRDAFQRRRCLIPASGFYEWKQGKGGKQPYYARMRGGEAPLAFAAIWERGLPEGVQEGDSGPGSSTAILTMPAEGGLEAVHHRMPVMLRKEDYKAWISPGDLSGDRFQSMLERAYRGDVLDLFPVDRRVGRADAEGPELIQAIDIDAHVEDKRAAGDMPSH